MRKRTAIWLDEVDRATLAKIRKRYSVGPGTAMCMASIGAVVFAILLYAGCFVLPPPLRRRAGIQVWVMYSWITGMLVLFIVAVGIVGTSFAENGAIPVPIALLQHVVIILGWAWLALTARCLLRRHWSKWTAQGAPRRNEQPVMPLQMQRLTASISSLLPAHAHRQLQCTRNHARQAAVLSAPGQQVRVNESGRSCDVALGASPH